MNIQNKILSTVIGLLYAAGTVAAPVNAATTAAPAAENTIPLLVVSVGFANVPYSNDQDVSQMFFKDAKSVTQYFNDQSYGQFTYVPAAETSANGTGSNTNTADKANDGVIHVTLSSDHADWADLVSHDGSDEEKKAAYSVEYAKTLFPALSEALKEADSYVDFASFDKNGDGTIQKSELALCFQIAGSEASELEDKDYKTVDRKKYFWSNASSLQDLITNGELENTEVPQLDGVKVSDYIGVAELRDGTNLNGTAVICHELGHYLGLPDLYDTAYTTDGEWGSYQVNNLSLMCSGNSVKDPDGSGYLQASLDMWSKIQLKWVKPQEVTKSGTYTISAADYDDLSKQHRALRITTPNKNEYYIIENRQAVKWDKGLTPALRESDENKADAVWNQDGLIIWHVDMTDYTKYEPDNTINVATHRPCVMPLFGEYVKADGDTYTILGEKADPSCGFFSKDIWESRYAATVGKTLELPMYGTGADADKRSGRKGSGIKIGFVSASGADMQITVDLGDGKLTEPTETTTTEETTTTTEETTTTTEETTTTTEATTTTTEATTTTTEETTTTTEATTTNTEATTTSTEATTTNTEATTTQATTATAPTETTPTLPEGAYSLDQLCDMALNDYRLKHGTRSVSASAMVNTDGKVTIQISNEYDGHVSTADYYIVDPVTGKGQTISGEEINLPQTGNNSASAAAAAGTALLLTIGGFFTMMKSGMLRKKEQ